MISSVRDKCALSSKCIMRNVLACMFLPYFTILKANSAWIRAVIESRFNPFSSQDILAIFSQPIAEQFCDQYLVLPIFCLNAEDCSIWGGVNLVSDLFKSGLGKLDYFSKMSCSFFVQSSIPLWQNSQSAKSTSQTLLILNSTFCTNS